MTNQALLLSNRILFLNTAGPLHLEQRRVFSGYLEDDEEASVDGIVTDEGTFDGHIQTRDKLFYVEPATR